MDRRNIQVGATYLCSTDHLSWSFIGRAISKKEDAVQVELIKCHPADRSAFETDHTVLDVNYLSILDLL